MATTSRQLQRGFVKGYSAVGSASLSSLVARVEGIVVGEGSRRFTDTYSFEPNCSLPSPDAISETVHARSSENGIIKAVNARNSVNEIIKVSRYNSICIPKLEEPRSVDTRQAGLIVQPDLLKRNRALGVALQVPYPSGGLRFMSAVTSEYDGLLVEEEKAASKASEKSDQLSVESELEQDSLYTSAKVPLEFTAADTNRYFTLSSQDVDTYFGEGLPPALLKEFEETRQRSFLIRGRVLELFDRFKRCQTDTLEATEPGGRVRSPASKHKPQCLLDGFIKSGKSAALAMLVHWARTQGWLVFYVPCGRDWTSGGMYYKNEQTGLFDTPVQAKTILEGFLKSHGSLLATIPYRLVKPLLLGEGAGVGKLRGPQELSLPEGASLRDLVEKGIAVSQAAVGVVLRIREELPLVQEAPVLICIDEFNSWFTFSHFHEATGTRSRRPIHAREVSMVNAFRTMEGPLMMATAFSGSLAVGKLPVQLPGVPKNVRFPIPRYSLEEATAAMIYYHSRQITSKEPSMEDIKKLFYLTNGNGEEMRTLARLIG